MPLAPDLQPRSKCRGMAKRWLLGAAGVFLLAAGGTGGFAVGRSGSPSPRPATSPRPTVTTPDPCAGWVVSEHAVGILRDDAIKVNEDLGADARAGLPHNDTTGLKIAVLASRVGVLRSELSAIT